MTAAGQPFLEVKDLKIHFPTDDGVVKSVDGLSFSVERGRTLGIVGESGSGKSVTSLGIMGLYNKRNAQVSGEIWLDGDEIVNAGPESVRKLRGNKLAMIFQDPLSAMHPYYTVGHQIMEAYRVHHRVSKQVARKHAVDMLGRVGIPQPERRADDYPHQFSGGMRQRAMIAMSLVNDPKLLIADEPTTALDVTVQAQILDLLATQQRERSMSMILVTHDLGVVANRTDEIAVMYGGQIVEKAPTPVIFRAMRHPYTEALMRSIPRIENPSHTRLDAIPGRPPDLANLPPGCRFAPRCRNAQPRCLEENPPLYDAEQPGHQFRCFFPVGTPAGEEARERNLRNGSTAAGTRLDDMTRASA